MTELNLESRLAKFQADQGAQAPPEQSAPPSEDLESRLAAFQKDNSQTAGSGSVFDQRGPITRTLDWVGNLPADLGHKLKQAQWELTTPEGHAEMTRAFIRGIPLAARVGGAMAAPFTGGSSMLAAPLLSEAIGQGADLATEAATGGIQNKPLAVRGGQAALNIASQLPFGIRPTGFTPELEQYTANLGPKEMAEEGQKSIYAAKPGPVETFAGNKAFRSSNPNLRDQRRAMGRAQSTTDLGNDWNRLGIVSSTPAKSAEAAESVLNTKVPQLGQTYTQLDKMLTKIHAAPGDTTAPVLEQLNPQNLFASLRQNVLEPLANDENFDAATAQLEKRLSRWNEIYGDKPTLTFSDLHDMRMKIDKSINWPAEHLNPDVGFYNSAAVDMRNTLQDMTTNAANDVSGQIGVPAMGDKIRALNRDISSSLVAKEYFNKAVAAAARNRAISPSDYGVTGMGAILGEMGGGHFGALAGAGVGLAHHFARVYGNQLMAQGAYWAAKTASLTPAARAVLSDYATTLAPQLGRAALPDDIPQQVWNRVQAVDALEKQKAGLPENQQRGIEIQQQRLPQRIAQIGSTP